VVLPIITIVCGFLKDIFSLRNPRTITHLPSGYQMVQSDRKPSITANQVNYIVYKKFIRHTSSTIDKSSHFLTLFVS